MIFQAVVMITLVLIVGLLFNIAHNLGAGIMWIIQTIQQKGSNNNDRTETD